MSTSSITEVLCRVLLEESVIKKYEDRAQREGHLTAEGVMRKTLQQYVDVDSTKPLVLSDHQRQRLERLLGRNFSDSDSLVRHIEQAMTIQVTNTEIPLTPRLLERLQSRCIGVPFDKFIRQTVIRLLEEFAGVR